MAPTLVVVSHYNARRDELLRWLLLQLGAIPAGEPFDVRVVVNQARDMPLDLQEDFPGVDFRFRENVGMNIGAWESGWREGARYENYVFLQEECMILRPNWLRAYLKGARQGKLIGEYKIDAWKSWEEWGRDFDRSIAKLETDRLRERLNNWNVPFILDYLACHGIDPGPSATHVQALIMCASRDTLEKIGGFLIGRDYRECVAAEVAFSRKAAMLGIPLEQAATFPFEYILHDQYMVVRYRSRSAIKYIKGLLKRNLPERLVRSLLDLKRRAPERLMGPPFNWT